MDTITFPALNIYGVDFLPGRNKIWPLANVPWSDGFAFVSPVDHYGERGRNGLALFQFSQGKSVLLTNRKPQMVERN
ncbi:MAG: hypothetical protein WD398_04555 [Cyclobacteriaceae bacterium]